MAVINTTSWLCKATQCQANVIGEARVSLYMAATFKVPLIQGQGEAVMRWRGGQIRSGKGCVYNSCQTPNPFQDSIQQPGPCGPLPAISLAQVDSWLLPKVDRFSPSKETNVILPQMCTPSPFWHSCIRRGNHKIDLLGLEWPNMDGFSLIHKGWYF